MNDKKVYTFTMKQKKDSWRWFLRANGKIILKGSSEGLPGQLCIFYTLPDKYFDLIVKYINSLTDGFLGNAKKYAKFKSSKDDFLKWVDYEKLTS